MSGLNTVAFLALILAACEVQPTPEPPRGVLKAGFVVLDGVYNSELTAPYDVLHHSVFRDQDNFIEPFIVSPDGKPLSTFEGITITPHYSFDDAPEAQILVIPSTVGSMDADLENAAFMTWLTSAVDAADWVITVCDGAFPLAATGRLDGRMATTFPADRGAFARMFPDVDVLDDVNFVVDGSFITSVGGALSFEPALFLVETLYGKDHAERTAEGLVLEWNAGRIPHRIR